MPKWCDECQKLVEPKMQYPPVEREGGQGMERGSPGPPFEVCPNDPGDLSHMLSDPDEPAA
jgi:hypothetical protein